MTTRSQRNQTRRSPKVNDLGQQLLGTWAVVRAELGGEPMPPEAAAQIEIEFGASGDQRSSAGGTYRVRFAGEISDSGHFQLFAVADHFSKTETALPRQITLYGKTGTNAGRTLPGILQLRGDRLKLCLALEGDAPPSTFASSANTSEAPCYLVTYKRKA